MSWDKCAITGELLEDPVISAKSGHIFERRIIEKTIEATGKCPITD
jgi:pre-mRNA-processing factor 19